MLTVVPPNMYKPSSSFLTGSSVGPFSYFRGAREQAHNFGDNGSLAKKQKKKKKEKTPFCLFF